MKVHELENKVDDTTSKNRFLMLEKYELEDHLEAATTKTLVQVTELDDLQARYKDLKVKCRALEFEARQDGSSEVEDLWVELHEAHTKIHFLESTIKRYEAREARHKFWQSGMTDKLENLKEHVCHFAAEGNQVPEVWDRLVRNFTDMYDFHWDALEEYDHQEEDASPPTPTIDEDQRSKEPVFKGLDEPIDTPFDESPSHDDSMAKLDESMIVDLTIKDRSAASHGSDDAAAPESQEPDSDTERPAFESTANVRKRLSRSQRKKALKAQKQAAEGKNNERRSENRRKKDRRGKGRQRKGHQRKGHQNKDP
ncbi:MAG: hypothetical protein Q9202_007056 [Teloschistes flavicans]